MLLNRYYSVSPYAYCANNPVICIDPIGMEPVYNMKGIYLGTTSEGFTGDVMIYWGHENIYFKSYGRKELERNHFLTFTTYDKVRNSLLSGKAKSKIWKSVVSHFEETCIVHEWYSHVCKKTSNILKSHRLAYKNVINYKPFWDKTTDNYKDFILWQLRYYTEKETGRS